MIMNDSLVHLARDRWVIPTEDGCLIGRRANVLRKARGGPEFAEFVVRTQALLAEGGLTLATFKEELTRLYPAAFIDEALHYLLNLGIVALAEPGMPSGPPELDFGADAAATAEFLSERTVSDISAVFAGLATSRIALLGSGRLARRVADALADLGPALVSWIGPGEENEPPGPDRVSRRKVPVGSDILAEAFATHDLVVAVADDPIERLRQFPAINAANLAGARRPWICAYVDGMRAMVGPLFVPPETGCHRCMELREENHLPYPEEFALFRTALANRDFVCTSNTPPAVLTMASGLIASEVFKVLARVGHPASYQTLIVLDLDLVETERHTLLKVPFCDACGPHLTRPFRKTWDI